jgi:hypothetical protein
MSDIAVAQIVTCIGGALNLERGCVRRISLQRMNGLKVFGLSGVLRLVFDTTALRFRIKAIASIYFPP